MRLQCSICQDDLLDVSRKPCALKCGHVFHYECFLQWLQHAGNCPKCRTSASEKSLVNPLFFDVSENSFLSSSFSAAAASSSPLRQTQANNAEVSRLKEKISELTNSLNEKTAQLKTAEAKITASEQGSKKLKDEVSKLKQECARKSGMIDCLTRQVVGLETLQRKLEKVVKERNNLEEKLKNSQKFRVIVDGSESEAESIFSRHKEPTRENMDALLSFLAILKQERDRGWKEAESRKRQSTQLMRELATQKKELKLVEQKLLLRAEEQSFPSPTTLSLKKSEAGVRAHSSDDHSSDTVVAAAGCSKSKISAQNKSSDNATSTPLYSSEPLFEDAAINANDTIGVFVLHKEASSLADFGDLNIPMPRSLISPISRCRQKIKGNPLVSKNVFAVNEVKNQFDKPSTSWDLTLSKQKQVLNTKPVLSSKHDLDDFKPRPVLPTCSNHITTTASSSMHFDGFGGHSSNKLQVFIEEKKRNVAVTTLDKTSSPSKKQKTTGKSSLKKVSHNTTLSRYGFKPKPKPLEAMKYFEEQPDNDSDDDVVILE